MRPKSIVLLMLALGCGVVASLGINRVMSRGTPQVAAGDGDKVPIYVALKDIEINDLIPPEALKREPWPKDRVPPGAITKLEQIKGRRARQKIFAGEPILEQKLLPKGEKAARPTDYVPPGYRVVAVRVDAQATGGYLVKPGDRVDLIVHMKKNPARNIYEETTKTFLQNVKVFAVDNVYVQRDGKKVTAAKTVSLLLTPEEAEKVTFASQLGKIVLALRPPGDETQVVTRGVTVNEMLRSSSTRIGQPVAAGQTPKITPPQRESSSQLQGLLSMFSAAIKGKKSEKSASAENSTSAKKSKKEEPWKIVLLRGDQLEQLVMVGFGQFEPAVATSSTDDASAEDEDADDEDEDGEDSDQDDD